MVGSLLSTPLAPPTGWSSPRLTLGLPICQLRYIVLELMFWGAPSPSSNVNFASPVVLPWLLSLRRDITMVCWGSSTSACTSLQARYVCDAISIVSGLEQQWFAFNAYTHIYRLLVGTPCPRSVARATPAEPATSGGGFPGCCSSVLPAMPFACLPPGFSFPVSDHALLPGAEPGVGHARPHLNTPGPQAAASHLPRASVPGLLARKRTTSVGMTCSMAWALEAFLRLMSIIQSEA